MARNPCRLVLRQAQRHRLRSAVFRLCHVAEIAPRHVHAQGADGHGAVVEQRLRVIDHRHPRQLRPVHHRHQQPPQRAFPFPAPASRSNPLLAGASAPNTGGGAGSTSCTRSSGSPFALRQVKLVHAPAGRDDEQPRLETLDQGLDEQPLPLDLQGQRRRVGPSRDGLDALRERHRHRHARLDVDRHRLRTHLHQADAGKGRLKPTPGPAPSPAAMPAASVRLRAQGLGELQPHQRQAPRIQRARLHLPEQQRGAHVFVADGPHARVHPPHRVDLRRVAAPYAAGPPCCGWKAACSGLPPPSVAAPVRPAR